jgi:general secretion pathway protein D
MRVLARAGVLLWVLLGSGAFGSAAWGQMPGGATRTGYQASASQPAVLISLAATDPSPGQTKLILTFAGPAPSFGVLTNDADKTAIALALVSRSPSASFAPRTAGLLQSVDFDQKPSALILRFTAARSAKVTVAPSGDRSLIVTFTTADNSGPAAPSVAGNGLPKSDDRAAGEDGFEVVFLKYADVSEVVGLLTNGLTVKSNDSFVPQEPAFGSAGMTGSSQPAPPPAAAAASDAMAESVDDAIAIDRRLNAIILKGSPERIARLKEKIAQIDVPVESVILETMFVELDEQGAKNVGLNFNNAANQLAVATFQTGAYITSGIVSGKGLSSVALQAAVYAEVQAGHGRIVSKPRIAAESGGTAKIITGDALPILTSIALSGVNAVSQQVQYVNVGVTLQIAPRVSSDGFVTSHIFCVVSSVTGTSQGYPTISQREAETAASVRDGDTFVIGGLTQDSDISSDTRVPVLGQVPLLGDLFTYKNGTKSKTELYIVVTPHVLRHGAPSALVVDATDGAQSIK